MKHQKLLGLLWLGLLLGAAAFCILWGGVPTKSAQLLLRPRETIRVIAVELDETPTPTARRSPPPTPSPSPTPSPTPDPSKFSFIWYSDTQYYAYKRPEVFRAMTQWTVEHASEYNALAVLHTGDIVDNHLYERHWNNAASALDLLDGALPLYCVAGNHDVGADTVDYTMYRQADFCDVTDSSFVYQDGVCWILPIVSRRILRVGIGWQTDNAYLDWVRTRIAAYPDYTAILLVHSYLEDNGTLTENGRLLEQEIVSVSPNVRLILCGHKDGSVRRQQTYDDGTRTVNAILYNFQDDKKNGLGYLRILTFDPVDRSLSVTTYSPYLDDYNYYSTVSKDTFAIPNAF